MFVALDIYAGGSRVGAVFVVFVVAFSYVNRLDRILALGMILCLCAPNDCRPRVTHYDQQLAGSQDREVIAASRKRLLVFDYI